VKVKKTMNSLVQDSDNPHLQQIMAYTQRLQKLENLVKETLTSPLKQHCWVANYRNGCLIIGADSANWTFYLRFQEQALIQQLQQYPEFADLNKIECYIKPTTHIKQEAKPEATFQLTNKSVQQLTETAALTNDPTLRKIFSRLANSIRALNSSR
jgi:hypothetical protein